MSTTPYTSVSVTGYNANPPPDDGTRNAANQVKYATTKEKLADPLNTALVSINTNVGTAFAAVQTYLAGHIQGLITSNSSGDTAHDIDIAAGVAVDSTGVEVLQLSTAITKRLDAAWVVGTGNGGLDTGTVAADTWYYLHAIKRSDTGVVDVLFSTSATSPTLPTDYDYFRRIAAVRTDASSNILAYIQFGNEFQWVSEVLDVDNATVGTTAALTSLTVPNGITTIAHFAALTRHDTQTPAVYIKNPLVTGVNPNGPTLLSIGIAFSGGSGKSVITDTAGRVNIWATSNGTVLSVVTEGWTDLR